MTNIKKKVLIFILLLISSLIFIGIFVGLKTWHDTMYAIFPSMRQEFNYSEKPVFLTIDKGYITQYRIPKAYFNRKILYKNEKHGIVSYPISIWASFKDDMAPWTLSKAFKRRDSSGVTHIYIYPGVGGEFKKQFPYYQINRSKERGGGINRGKYKEVFTRYDDKPTRIVKADGTVKYRLGQFFLIPGEEDFLITCPTAGNQDTTKCTVKKHYAPDISYHFLIPHHIVKKYREYDKKVQALIDRLHISTTKSNQNESK